MMELWCIGSIYANVYKNYLLIHRKIIQIEKAFSPIKQIWDILVQTLPDMNVPGSKLIAISDTFTAAPHPRLLWMNEPGTCRNGDFPR